MKKILFKSIYCLICLTTFLLCGCAGEDILAEKLQTAALEKEIARLQQSVKGNAEQIPSFLYEDGSCLAYQSLNEAEAVWYRNIAEGLGLMQEEIRLDEIGLETGLDETDVDRIFQCVLSDHPELFYVEGYTYRKYTREEEIVAILFSGSYSMNSKQALSRKAEIDAQTDMLLAEASALTDDYDKVKFVYDTLIRNTEYDLNAPDNQNIYSVFVNHKSVCQGYAKAVQYLLERMNVECALVLGNVDTGEGHAWNLVKVNGNYYYVDATWGDASFQSDGTEIVEEYVPEISYDYLCITTEQLLRTHVIGGYAPVPLCVSEQDNYYVREGALFTAYDKVQMQNVLDRLYTEQRQDVTVKCVDEKIFWQIYDAMIAEQEIFDYLPSGSDSIGYVQNEKQLSMTFWVTNE